MRDECRHMFSITFVGVYSSFLTSSASISYMSLNCVAAVIFTLHGYGFRLPCVDPGQLLRPWPASHDGFESLHFYIPAPRVDVAIYSFQAGGTIRQYQAPRSLRLSARVQWR